MKPYIRDLENTFGTWEEDFKRVIEDASPNVKEDFINILQALPNESIPEYLEWIINMGYEDLISNNINIIMQIASRYNGRQKSWIFRTIDLLGKLQDREIDESISKNLMSIIKGPYTKGNTWSIINLCEVCRDIGNTSDLIDENYGEIIEAIFCNNEYLSNNPAELNKIKNLILRLAQQENVRLSDIEDAGNGQYSKCMKIGTIVLKFGENRELEDLPEHRRILKPKLRFYFPKNHTDEIEQGNLKHQDVIAIECQDLVNTDWDKDLTEKQKEETLYALYRELRNSAYIWTDIKPENVGRLLKPNIVKYGVQSLNGESVEIKTSLPTGELVIFDTDRIYKEDKLPKFNNSATESTYIKFEMRYNEEQQDR